MDNELEKDLQGNFRNLIQILSAYLLGETEENHKNLILDSRCPGRGLRRPAPGYKSTELALTTHTFNIFLPLFIF
jgi:hypothetical protein